MAILVVIPKEEVTIQVKKPDQLKVTIREMFRTPEKVEISKKIMTPKPVKIQVAIQDEKIPKTKKFATQEKPSIPRSSYKDP